MFKKVACKRLSGSWNGGLAQPVWGSTINSYLAGGSEISENSEQLPISLWTTTWFKPKWLPIGLSSIILNDKKIKWMNEWMRKRNVKKDEGQKSGGMKFGGNDKNQKKSLTFYSIPPLSRLRALNLGSLSRLWIQSKPLNSFTEHLKCP